MLKAFASPKALATLGLSSADERPNCPGRCLCVQLLCLIIALGLIERLKMTQWGFGRRVNDALLLPILPAHLEQQTTS